MSFEFDNVYIRVLQSDLYNCSLMLNCGIGGEAIGMLKLEDYHGCCDHKIGENG